MHVFRCERCDGVVAFIAARCPRCDALLAYDDSARLMRVLEPTDDAAVFIRSDGARVWRCLNSAYGCNWTIDAGSGDVWCRSCRLTRGRPDDGRPDAVAAWSAAEAAKRRLIHQLDGLGLRVLDRSTGVPHGLAFDLVHLPGEGGITGHLGGVVTLDLAEVDDRHRFDLQRRLGEPFRTVLGHLRHEIGHYYWPHLVGPEHLAVCRVLFGDESADYQSALDAIYSATETIWDPTRFVSPYATAHPLEDWAETFAHYLHIVDLVDTAIAHSLVPDQLAERLGADPARTVGFRPILEVWRSVNRGFTALAESIGSPTPFPFDHDGPVIEKLEFVHERVDALRSVS